MPFKRSHLNQGAVSGALGQITTYSTEDQPGEVERAGYFDKAAVFLRDRDPLIVNYGDDVRLYRVARPDEKTVRLFAGRSPQGATNGRKILTFGDSLLAEGNRAFNASPNGEIASWGGSPITWAMALGLDCAHDVWHDAADPNGRLFTGANHGVIGQTIEQMLARLDAALAMRPDWIVAFPGVNDLTDNRPIGDIIRDQRLLLDRILAAGVGLVSGPTLPRDLASWPDNETDTSLRRRPKLHALNRDRWQWFVENQQRGRVLWYALDRDFVDGTASSTLPRADATRDGTHFTHASAYRAGKRLRDILLPFIPPGPGFVAGADDVYDAALRPFGSILPNPLMQGTAGSFKPANGITGTFAGGTTDPAKYYLERFYPAAANPGTTAIGSVEPAADLSGIWQVLTFNPTPGTSADLNPFHRFFLRPGTASTNSRDIAVPAGLAAGQWVQMHARIKLSAWAGWGRTELRCEVRDAARVELGRMTGFYAMSFDPAGAATEAYFPYANEEMDLFIRTPPFKLPAGSVYLRPWIFFEIDGTLPGTPVARIGQIAIKPVADPRPLWNAA